MKALLVIFALTVAAFGLAPLHRAEEPVAGNYIVVFHDNVTEVELTNAAQNVQVQHSYRLTIKGFSGQLNDRQLAAIRLNPSVKWVEEDGEVHLAQTCINQNGADWGLNRISQRALNLDGVHKFPPSAGEGVDSYIIDTGIYIDHNDFQGRASFGYKSDPSWSNLDGNGHGTHVASTVGGNLYGVAKKVTLIAVKVLSDGGSGTFAGVISGVEWATGQKLQKGRPSTGNMSLSGGRTPAVNAACDAASRAGLLIVVAAGNSNFDACNYSPSSADDVVSVGATDVGADQNGNNVDVRSYFSNWGTCVDLLAPGSDILGAWIGNPTATRVISGTSMASPHVCGVSSLLIGQDPTITIDELKTILGSSATPNVINLLCESNGCNQTPNRMLYNGCT